MKTVQLVFHFQGITRFNLAVVDGELILYPEKEALINNDRDFWVIDEHVDQFLADPFESAPVAAKKMRDDGRNWTIEVTEYTALEPTKYQPFEIESRGKARRRAAILAQMKPEDRALFE